MDRRKFLKQVSLWSAGIIMTPPVFNLTPQLFAASQENADILVAKGEDYQVMVQKIVQSFGGMHESLH